MLPTGFYFDDERWDKIWQRLDEKGNALTMADLRQLFPDEAVLRVQPLIQTGDMILKEK